MLRRDFVLGVVSAGLAPRLLLAQQSGATQPPPPAPVPWTTGLNPKTPLPVTAVAETVAESELRFFSPAQMATLNRLSDLLLPPIGDKPGALEAETPAFLDFLIGGSPEPRRKLYTGGLEWLDGQSQKKFKMPFAKLSKADADDLLKPWLRTWMSDHPPTEAHADFINIVHDDVRTATVNSKAWAAVPSSGAEASIKIDLYWSPIEPELYGEDRGYIAPHVLAAAKSSHPMPTYSR
jgi:hypothetical protein